MFADLMKHQSLVQINRPFIKLLREKFSNRITIAEYIIARLVHEDVRTAHTHTCNAATIENMANKIAIDNRLFQAAEQHPTFELRFSKAEQVGGIALTYAKIFKRPGVIFSASNAGFRDISVPMYQGFINGHPLMLISLYENDWTPKITPIHRFIKDAHTVKTSTRFPHALEYMITLSIQPKPGPIHLEILNDILADPVDLEDIEHYPEQ